MLHAFMREHPLATLVTVGADGIAANHIPLLIDPEPQPFGTLLGHVARANPVWRETSRTSRRWLFSADRSTIFRRHGIRPSRSMGRLCRPGTTLPCTLMGGS